MDVIEAAATKWNFNVYYPGAGVGGHCLPVDPYYLVTKAEELGYHLKVITAGRAVNDYMPLHVFELLVDALNEGERDVYKAIEGADAVVLMTGHREFREIDLRRVREEMRTPVMIDGRRVFDRDGVRRLGFEYRGVEAE
jgi:UDP-N-acetyl-D-mannosaminuronate dehydrogenase